MTNIMNCEYASVKVVDGLDLFEEESGEARHAAEVLAKVSGARDRQKKKKK